MTTASTHLSIKGRLRMVALAGILVLSAMVPAMPVSLASTDTVQSTPEEMTDQFDIDGSEGLIGLTAIVDARDSGVNLRQTPDHDGEILQAISEGTLVELRVDRADTVYDPDGITRWWPVSVGGQDGWISGFYLADPDAPATDTATASEGAARTSMRNARVSRVAYEYSGSMVAEISADGEGLVLRSEPDQTSETVTTIPEGAQVDLRIDMYDTVYDAQGTRWWPVAFEGAEGWVSGFYLIDPGATPPASISADDATAIFVVGDTVRVKTPSERGLVVRAEPVPDGDRITSLQEGQTVQILDGPVSHEKSANGWYLISTGDVSGYVDGDLLVLVEAAPVETPTEPAESAPDASADDAFAVGDWAEIKTADGDGVELRAGASANSDQRGYAPNQGLVEILSGPENGWYEVRWDRQTGYIDGDVLIPTKGPTLAEREAEATETAEAQTSESTDEADSTDEGVFKSGDYGKVDSGSGVGVNIREQATQDSGRAGYLAEDAVVKVTEGPTQDNDGNLWYRVTDGSQNGWVRGDLLVPTEAPADASEVATEQASGEDAETAPVAQESTTGFILPLADFAFTQDYGCSSLGFYPYSPDFGCSVHDGVDLAAPSGSPIYAVDDGTVVASGWCDCGLGYYVEIDHGGGLNSVYGHMASQPYVAVGQKVAQGEVIGPVGSTGLSTGPHTHFMVRQDGVTQDPKNYLPPLS